MFYYDRIANITTESLYTLRDFPSTVSPLCGILSLLVKIGEISLQLDRRRGYLDLRFHRIRRSSVSLRLLMTGSHGVLQFRFQLGGL